MKKLLCAAVLAVSLVGCSAQKQVVSNSEPLETIVKPDSESIETIVETGCQDVDLSKKVGFSGTYVLDDGRMLGSDLINPNGLLDAGRVFGYDIITQNGCVAEMLGFVNSIPGDQMLYKSISGCPWDFAVLEIGEGDDVIHAYMRDGEYYFPYEGPIMFDYVGQFAYCQSFIEDFRDIPEVCNAIKNYSME